MPNGKNELYEFGDFRLDVAQHRIERRDGQKSGSLPEKAFQTLVYLLRNHGALISKEALISAIWRDAIVEENNLGKAIHAIRRFLGEDSKRSRYIETVPKYGYRFVADVIRIDEHGTPPSVDSPKEKNKSSDRSRAYDLYIRGKVKAASENPSDTEGAIKVLEAAVAIDPFYAPAYAQLARAYNTRSFKFASGPEIKTLQENADIAVAKALDLDPNLAEAHFARGLILWTKSKGFPHELAIRSFKRALELAPVDDEAHHQLSMVYSHVGLMNEAQEHLAKAIDINPNNTMARFRIGVYTAWQCRFEEALAFLKTVPTDVSPMLIDRIRAEVLVQVGRFEEAAMIVDRYLYDNPSDEGGSLTSVNALLLAKAGNAKQAEENIGHAIRIGKDFGHFHHTAYNVASAYAALDEHDQAIRWLETAADDGFPNFAYFAADPNLQGLRTRSRFVQLLSDLKGQGERFKHIA